MTKATIFVDILISISLIFSAVGLNEKILKIENSKKIRRQVSQEACNTEEFKCTSGQCIPKNFTCDGVPHCDDASDETAFLCLKNQCPEHNYRCSYGACVSGDSQCNGIKDCFDGSDEICSACPSIYNNSNTNVRCFYRNIELDNCVNPNSDTIAELSCNELYEFNTKSKFETLQCIDGIWNQTVPNCKPVCGKKFVDAEKLIINGEFVKKGEYPWQAALYTEKEKILFCGGSLITENIVLTAAHCVTRGSSSALIPKELIFVAVGKYYRNFSDSRDVNFQYSPVKEVIITREYRGIIQNYLGDLALMITEKVFKLSPNVLPVCVDWKSDFKEEFSNPSFPGIVTGWGLTTETDTPSQVLKELTVPFVQYKHCNLSFDYYQYLTHDKICAGYINKGSSVCKGDSGGGLVFPNPTDYRYYVTGIVSLSPRAPTEVGGCNSQNYGLYTKVSDYVAFMTSKTSLYGADRERCILLDHPKNGYWIVKKSSLDLIYKPGMSVLNGTRIHVYCKPTFNLEGLAEIICNNGVWSSSIGTCKGTVPSCVLPEYPDNGHWTVFGLSKFTFAPRMLVNEGTVIQLLCEGKSKAVGHKTIFCHNGTWNEELGTCVVAICPPIEQKNMTIKCSYNGVEIKNCTTFFDGIIVNITCNNMFTISNPRDNGLGLRCVRGIWDRTVPTCVPGQRRLTGCGRKSKEAQNYPWVVTLYGAKNNTLLCGGTLITSKIVLTAAVCVTNAEGVVEPKETYIVAAGKYYRNFNDSRDQFAQFSKLKEITVPKEYKGVSQNYFADLAVLMTEKDMIITKNVMPVCMDWDSQAKQIPYSTIGLMSGWGFVSKDSTPSETLQDLFPPFVPNKDCVTLIHILPENYQGYLTDDKFCVGIRNGSHICKSDAGTGLTFHNSKDNRYYLYGLVGMQPINVRNTADALLAGLWGNPEIKDDGSCKEQFALLTDVRKYIKLIREKMSQT